MIAFRQSGLTHSWPGTLKLIAFRATSVVCNMREDSCQPSVATDVAMPLLLVIAVSCEIMRRAVIGCAVPAGSHIGGFGSNRVVLTDSSA